MDCAEGRWTKDLEVVARGGGVGLSRRLRDGMASDWRSSGALELDVSVVMYRVGGQIGTDDIPRTFDGKVKMIRDQMNDLDWSVSPVLSVHHDGHATFGVL
ncbi:hypothetical protein HU200_055178 [Digitaria exilis]|uniref:Uncharacterized protein n=1 Tax=Digitaria exilis TaxID=1010633 RepID=A0A835E3I6_9POAL|nr:hypothetical protein HU200_055178 [Digitaria exilis]